MIRSMCACHINSKQPMRIRVLDFFRYFIVTIFILKYGLQISVQKKIRLQRNGATLRIEGPDKTIF